jgi:hypothetical protein
MKLIYMDRDSEQYRRFWEDVTLLEQQEERKIFSESKYNRLKKSHTPRKANMILAFENFFELNDCYYDTHEDFTLFYNWLKNTVNSWVNRFCRNWSKWRLSRPDFESVFWEEAWIVVNEYSFWDTNYYLYETLELSFKRRGLDVVRKATKTKQGKLEHGAGRLPEWFDEVYPGTKNTEKDVLNRLLVDQIMNEPSLSPQERRLLQVLCENYDASYEELAKIMGLRHRTRAWRLMQSIRNKLEKYREDALAADTDAYKWQYREPDQRKLSRLIEPNENEDNAADVNRKEGFESVYRPYNKKDSIRKIKSGLKLSEPRRRLKLKSSIVSPRMRPEKDTAPKVKKKQPRKSKNRRKDRVINYPPGFNHTSLF